MHNLTYIYMRSICLCIAYIDLTIIAYLIKIHMTYPPIYYYKRCVHASTTLYSNKLHLTHIEYIYIALYIHSILF